LDQVPTGEVSSIIKALEKQLRVIDAVAATKDILQELAEHQSDDQVTSRKEPPLVFTPFSLFVGCNGN
jgi:hypothetical protein